MKFLKERAKKRKKEFMSHIKDEVLERWNSGVPITYDEYSDMRMNSYEFKLLFPLFDNNTLIKITQYALDQEGNERLYEYDLAKHYTDAVLRQYVHELMDRLEISSVCLAK